jgi:tetratricopeptide (TPR) repeat protein
VDATFTLTIQQLRERNIAAVQLLELCALLAPDELPIDLLLSQPHRLPEPLATAARDPLQRQRLYRGDHPAVATSLNNLANRLRQAGDDERARELHEQALAMRRRLYRGDHPDLASSMKNLANQLLQAGDDERARELDEQALAMRQRLYEGDHPAVASSMNNLALDLRQAGEQQRARELDEQALAMRQRLAGE